MELIRLKREELDKLEKEVKSAMEDQATNFKKVSDALRDDLQRIFDGDYTVQKQVEKPDVSATERETGQERERHGEEQNLGPGHQEWQRG
ncbi:hypothetical protein NpNSSI1_00003616 [Neofusicoccum parvum]|uniref:Uncharacterized protein n=2 Tax=Neofusicoccum parvum TaxID=310453 RepID=R1FWG0_BOTPV|nr:hypothetical protein UCRNP2_9863 [Neofusicoccum parvum UCRNP2]GME28655.1 hypothetical protein NpPPO83_00008093 [Neofusicoccum parvum]GME58892.1 hypothetical protein NpNSSI1_00003616 [Neofusicoccum parvum]